MAKLLEVKNLHVRYGSIHAVKGISFHVEQGEIVTLIGANGAGKSTTLRALSGIVPSDGDINFNGQSLKQVKVYDRVKIGIAQSPEGRGAGRRRVSRPSDVRQSASRPSQAPSRS